MNDAPSITIGPLKIWVWGRQFPDSTDYWDGNWTNATACCEGAGSRVEVTGAFLHLGELERWRNDLERFYPFLEGSVMLPTIEPTLSVRIEGKTTKTGHLKCTVDITGDPKIPCPHQHCYNPEFDKIEDEIMESFAWKKFPLQEEHDDP